MTLIERIEKIEKIAQINNARFNVLKDTLEVKEYLSLQYAAFCLDHKTLELKKMVNQLEEEIEKMETWSNDRS